MDQGTTWATFTKDLERAELEEQRAKERVEQLRRGSKAAEHMRLLVEIFGADFSGWLGTLSKEGVVEVHNRLVAWRNAAVADALTQQALADEADSDVVEISSFLGGMKPSPDRAPSSNSSSSSVASRSRRFGA